MLGFGAKGANFVERTKLIQVTMRIIINVTKCLLSKTILYVMLKISPKATRLKVIEIPVMISNTILSVNVQTPVGIKLINIS